MARDQDPLLQKKQPTTLATAKQLATAKKAMEELQGGASLEQAHSKFVKFLEGFAAVLHPVYEGFNTTLGFAWFIKNMLKIEDVETVYGIAIAAGAAAMVPEAGMVTIPELEKLMGRKFNVSGIPSVLQIPIPLLVFMGTVAGGAKFGMDVCAALTANGQTLSTLEKVAAAAVAVFRFGKERLVSYERAREALSHLGFSADHVIYQALNEIPLVNGCFPFIELDKIILNNQPLVQGGLHGAAMFQVMEMAFGGDSLISDAMHDPLHKGWKLLIAGYVSLLAATGEKTAQQFDAETVRASIEKDKVRHALLRLATSENLGLNQDRVDQVQDQARGVRGRAAAGWHKFKSAVSTANTWFARVTTTPTLNFLGNMIGKVVDTVRWFNPLPYIVGPRMAQKLIKAIGQGAYGAVAAKQLNMDGMPFVFDGIDPKNTLEVVSSYAGLVGVTMAAAVAQWNARDAKARHAVTQAFGPIEGENQPTRRQRCGIAARDVCSSHVAPKEGELSENNWGKRALYRLWCADDPLTDDVLKADLQAYAGFLVKTLQVNSDGSAPADPANTGTIYQALLTACLENPELAISIHFMAKASFNVSVMRQRIGQRVGAAAAAASADDATPAASKATEGMDAFGAESVALFKSAFFNLTRAAKQAESENALDQLRAGPGGA